MSNRVSKKIKNRWPADVLRYQVILVSDGHSSFSKKAAQVEKETDHLLGYTYIDAVQAIELTHEYQLARAAAPLIPIWVYNSMRSELNDLWAEYRRHSQ